MIEITCDTGVLTAKLAAASAEAGKRLLARMKPIGARLHNIVQREKIARGGLLEPRTGNLQRSIQSAANNPGATTVQGDTLATRVWFDPAIAKYGAIHEYGGAIVPKRSQNLAIPLPAMKTGNGVTAREVFANPQAFGFKHVFVAKNVIFGCQGHGARGMVTTVPLFVLKRSVVIPARRPLRSTLEGSREWIAGEITAATQEVVAWLESAS
jgi:hypothetical protein